MSGTVTVSANATDNVGVAGVQFLLDGVAMAAEDTVAPYGVSWDTTTAASGTHVLKAVARDDAGNTTTSSSVTVTVSNSAAGLVAAWKQNSLLDLSVVGGATLLLSIPSFWLGLLLLLLFGLKLKWLPVIGYVPFSENFWQAASFIVLDTRV